MTKFKIRKGLMKLSEKKRSRKNYILRKIKYGTRDR